MNPNTIKFEIESKTIAEFNQMRANHDLVLQPDYQRKVVWSQAAKISLIETILLGLPIPEVYLSYETSADGRSIASVVDGQQRLTSIFNFIDNGFFLENLETSEDSEYFKSAYEGKYFKDLEDETKKEIWKYRLPIRRLSDIDDDEIRKVFARVNRVNMVLTSQEIKNALYPGPFQDFLKDCASHPITEKSGIFSGSRRNRGGDLEFFAESFGACLFGLVNKKTDFDTRYDELSKNFDLEYSDQAKRYIEILDYLEKNVNWSGRTRWSNIIDMYTLIYVTWNLDLENILSEIAPADFNRCTDLFQLIVNDVKKNPENKIFESSKIGPLPSGLSDSSHKAIRETIEFYISGIRNSSDIKARRSRVKSLEKWIKGFIEND
ncbi:DUF262 domain-containing protein [Rothia nasisuis]|uniref:DUF262 domain-containing protein n=1 Tax=Rothia nasisuis TaxID=2109647 RepID=UPI001F3BD983|nr:DUF262 domain-containing protein [Rothia nasisuis]